MTKWCLLELLHICFQAFEGYFLLVHNSDEAASKISYKQLSNKLLTVGNFSGGHMLLSICLKSCKFDYICLKTRFGQTNDIKFGIHSISA